MSKSLIKGLLLAIALVAIAVAFVRFNRVTLPDGPVPVVWDSEVCAHCSMHVGDPRFAAQLQTTEGEISNFDDPGCLFELLRSREVSIHAIYFRNHAGDGWLASSEAGFIPVDDTPMGYGIAAVPRDQPGAHDVDWAKARVVERRERGHRGP